MQINVLFTWFKAMLKFKKTRLYYEIQRYRQVTRLRQNLNHPEYGDLLKQLDKDGIAVIPNFMPADTCQKMLADLDVAFEQVKQGTFKGPFQYDNDKLIRIGDLSDYVPSTNAFYDHPMLDAVAKAYVDPKAYSYRREAELRDNIKTFQQADIPHIDDWRMRFKFFLYLTDVGPDNAPFTYYKNTHKDEAWKRHKNFEYERDGEFGAYGHFHPQELVAIRKQRELEELVCTGTAGTLIIADFRGIHRGSVLKNGRRVLLNSTYGI